MVKTLYVGNLSYRMTEDELKNIFAQYGDVTSAKIITDRETGRSRGFGFVEIDAENAQSAVEALDGKDVEGRNLKVNEARERKPNNKRY